MREIRTSGSEGGEPQPNAASLPLSKLGTAAFGTDPELSPARNLQRPQGFSKRDGSEPSGT